MKKANFYFAQLTDIHIGTNPKPAEAKLQFQWALSELESFENTPQILLITGDLVCNGRRDELEEFKSLYKDRENKVYDIKDIVDKAHEM